MKQILFALLVMLAVVSCKKEGGPAVKEKMLSKIFDDDVLMYQFEYSSDKKLKKIMRYTDLALTPYQVSEYEYDAKGQLEQKINFNGAGKAITRFDYTWTGDGNVAKYTATPFTGADSGKISYWVSFAYNEKKWIVKMSTFLANDDPAGYQVMDYNDNGAPLKTRVYAEEAAGATLDYQYDYVGAANRVHPAFRNAFIEPGNKGLVYYDAKSFQLTAFQNGLIKTVDTYTMSDRKTEAALWLEQTITYKRTFPGGPGPAVSKMKYEYIDL